MYFAFGAMLRTSNLKVRNIMQQLKIKYLTSEIYLSIRSGVGGIYIFLIVAKWFSQLSY